MTLSIIIPTHKRAFQVQQLLGSIAQQDFPKEDLQLLLISNLRDKKLREQAPYWENIFFDFKYLEVGQKGVNKARNMGIRFARGDILYFLDDDCLLENKKHLSWLVSEHKIKSDIGIGGAYKTGGQSHGLKKFYQENTEQWILDSISEKQKEGFEEDSEKQNRNFKEDSKKQKGQIVEPSEKQTEQLLGGNSSYKREVFDKGFYFDPSIIFGGSEKGFNQSLREQGWTLLFMDKLSVTHNLKLDLTDFIKKSFKQGQGSIKTQSKKEHSSLKGEWAFLHKDNHSFYSFLYNLFFKIGFFWEIASQGKKGKVFQVFRFIFLFFKSRWLFFRDYFAKWFYGSVLLRFLGVLWYGVGWLYGKILWPFYTAVMLKPLGKLWYGLGWFYGSVLLRFLGVLWYGVGWLYGKILWPFYTAVMLKPLGKLWYGLGWFYGSVLLRFLGVLWYGVGWLYGKILWPFYTAVMLKPLGKLWYGLGWFYGSVLLRFLGVLWYGVGWLYGKILWPFYTAVMLKPLGKLWYGLGWFYGSVLLRFLGVLWYGVGWLYGKILWPFYTAVMLKPLGKLWYGLGWFYGSVLLRFLGVLWYGVGWLYGKILWPFYTAVMLKPLGKLWYGLGWFYGSVLLRFLGVLWYGVGWLYGKILWPFYTAVMLKPLGKLWYGLGWFYGSVLLFLFHHSPPMKIYYFSKYQYYKRIKPLLNKNKLRN